MSKLQHRQTKIQDKRKTTSWRDFVMEICSRKAVNLGKNQGLVSVFADTDRAPHIVNFNNFEQHRSDLSTAEYNDGFLTNLTALYQTTPLPPVITFGTVENSDFADVTYNSKNAYLSFSVTSDCENVLYTFRAGNSVQMCLNSFFVLDQCSDIYCSSVIAQSMSVFYSRNIINSNNIWFSYGLVGCSECILCDNLDNQSYCIENISYSKEEYFVRKKKLLAERDHYEGFYAKVLQQEFLNVVCDSCDGAGLNNCHDIHNSRIGLNASHGNNIFAFGSAAHCEYLYDICMCGNATHFYAVCDAGAFSEHLYCCTQMANSTYCFYSYLLEGCSFCLGCVGLKNKSYCILNKQYSKEERYEKVDEIFGQMEQDGTLGQFFPATMNPFYFNDTAAYLIDPSFTTEEVTAAGYLWRDEPIKVDIPVGAEVVLVKELGNFEQLEDGEWKIDKKILNKIIQDHQGNIYRIVPMEYDFLVKHGLPLPRKHRLDRMKENFGTS